MLFELSRIAAFQTLFVALSLFGLPWGKANGQCPEKDASDQAKAPFYGRVVDVDGSPVTDARLTLQGPSHLSEVTDDQGAFQFPNVDKVGEYRLAIESSKWVGISAFSNTSRIFLDPQRPIEREFTLRRACQIQLTVVDENGKPVIASIYYSPIPGRPLRNLDQIKTNSEGVAMIGGLDPLAAKYMVNVNSNQHAPAHMIISVENPDLIDQQKLVLVAGKSITGKVTCSDGEPPVGWQIHAIPTWWTFGVYPQGVKVAEDGSFELPNIGNEAINLRIAIPRGDRMSTFKNILTNAKLWEMEQPLRLTLDQPSPKSTNYLTGTIRWIGKPLESGLTISGYCQTLKKHTRHHLKAHETDFKIGPIQQGVYRIRVDHPEVEVMNLRKIKDLNDLDQVKIPNEEPLQLVLRVRGKPHVQGIVVDAATREPIERYRYRVAKRQTLSGPNYVQDDEWKLGNDPSGRFKSDVIGPGVYSVSVVADGYAIQTSNEVNTDEQPDELLKFELGPSLSLTGNVVDVNGNVVNGATVRALSLASGAMDRVLDRFATMEGAVHTVDGRFTLQNLRAGNETIRIDHPDFAFKEIKNVEVTGRDEPLTIELSAGATLRGTVFDAQGSPEADVTLLFQDDYGYGGGGDEEAGKFGETVSDENGQYEIRHLPDATVYISRSTEWTAAGMVRQAVQLKDGKSHNVDLGGTSVMIGQLIINDQPVANARMQIGGADSIFGAMKMFTTTDVAGRFKFYGAPAGRWTLYRALGEDNREWVAVRELNVTAGEDLDLGDIRQKSGTLTIELKTEATAVPQNIQVVLSQDDAHHLFGRTIAMPLPRESSDSPFVFPRATPGSYQIVLYGLGSQRILKKVTVTDATLGTVIPLHIPTGKANLTVELNGEKQKPLDDTLVLWSADEQFIAYLVREPGKEKLAKYTASKLPEGRYSLLRGYDRDSDVLASIDISEKQENRISLTLPEVPPSQKGFCNLEVTDENGIFIPCQIRIKEDSGESIEQHRGPVGIRIAGTPGVYTLQIEQSGFKPVEQKIELIGTHSTNTDAEMKKTMVRLERTAKPVP